MVTTNYSLWIIHVFNDAFFAWKWFIIFLLSTVNRSPWEQGAQWNVILCGHTAIFSSCSISHHSCSRWKRRQTRSHSRGTKCRSWYDELLLLSWRRTIAASAERKVHLSGTLCSLWRSRYGVLSRWELEHRFCAWTFVQRCVCGFQKSGMAFDGVIICSTITRLITFIRSSKCQTSLLQRILLLSSLVRRYLSALELCTTKQLGCLSSEELWFALSFVFSFFLFLFFVCVWLFWCLYLFHQ